MKQGTSWILGYSHIRRDCVIYNVLISNSKLIVIFCFTDDCRNIANIAVELMRQGYIFRENGRLR